MSNRLPISIQFSDNQIEVKASSGGLASALRGVKEKIDFTWIGWPGSFMGAEHEQKVKDELHKQNLIPIFLSKEQEKYFYHSFCNSTLWPLFHYFTGHVAQSYKSWDYYLEVNALYADRILKFAPLNATIWIHDFHLMVLPQLLKEKRADLKIGFFLHIPFPASEVYRMFPKREALLEGVLGADYIGFHTSDYARHFKTACLRILGLDSNKEGILYHSRRIGVGIHPIGMNVEAFNHVFAQPDFEGYVQKIKERYHNYQVILGVERLDYTKGVDLKLQAFEKLLEKFPALIGNVILLQIIVPCRDESSEYQKHRSDIEKSISRINGKYSKPGFTPIQYIYQNLSLEELTALYCLADICVVASLRDGMNLVAQEFVYCASRGKSASTLLLSEFAGASHHLPHATIINPLDVEGLAKNIKIALETPSFEKTVKLLKMEELVRALDSPLWAKKFLKELEKVAHTNEQQKQTVFLNHQHIENLLSQMAEAKERQIILDYDGTLREITSYPQEARPTTEILALLEKLLTLPNTRIDIVSGRDHQTLEAWLGHLPIDLSAEHGFLKRNKNEKKWEKGKDIDLAWMPYVKEILNKAVDEVPGSFLESKSCILSWHYRMTDCDYGQWRAKELYTSLIQDLANLPVEIVQGKKVLEVRAQGISKGKYIEQLLKELKPNTFILCIGDDYTDQEMYAMLPETSVSIHVGERCLKSTFQLESPRQVRNLLTRICDAIQKKQINA